MAAGDSFFAPGYRANGSGDPIRKFFNISGGRSSVPGSEWAARNTDENGVAGVRVWRVK